nr:hypothetical protein [Nocardia sp. CS682]
MALDVIDGVGRESGHAIGTFDSHEVTVHGWSSDASSTVGRDSPSRDGCVAAQSARERVVLADQHDHAAALTRPETIGALVVHPHCRRGERSGLRESDQLERIDRNIDAANDYRVELSGGQRVTCCGNRQQRRRTCAIHGIAAATEVEVVTDPTGDGVCETARKAVFGDRRETRLEIHLVRDEEFSDVLGVPAPAPQRVRQCAPHIRPPQPSRVGPGHVAGQRIADDDTGTSSVQPFAGRKSGVVQCGRRGIER